MAYVEVQILREMKALTRPQLINIDDLSPNDNIIQLFPGWAGDFTSSIQIRCTKPTPYVGHWCAWPIMLLIDNIPLGEYRIVPVLMDYSEIPSGMAQFPDRANPDNQSLGGWHTFTARYVGEDPVLSGVYRS